MIIFSGKHDAHAQRVRYSCLESSLELLEVDNFIASGAVDKRQIILVMSCPTDRYRILSQVVCTDGADQITNDWSSVS